MPKVALNGGKVVIKGGKVGCSCCCPTGAPTFQWDTRPASKTKYGHLAFDYPVSNKRYLRMTYSGAVSAEVYHGDCSSTDYFLYTITFTQSGYSLWTSPTTADNTTTINTRAIGPSDDVDNTCGPIGFGGCYVDWFFFPATTDVITSTKWDQSVSGCHEHSGHTSVSLTTSGTVTRELTDEYTNEMLAADTEAALAPLDGDWNDTAGLMFFLSADELTLNLRSGPARIPVSGLGMVAGRAYRAVYVWRSQPLPTGTPTDSAEEYVEFTFTEGMESVPVEMPATPTTNVELTLVGVRWECGPFAP